jgi:F420-non-reducing hydrogenase small subunit
MKEFAVLQLSGCAGCEVALLNADAWMDSFQLAYMPLVISAYDVPAVELLMVSGAVHTDEDDLNLRHAVQRTRRQGGQVIAVGTCAISGGVANLGNRDEVRQLFLAEAARSHVPRLLDKSRPIDTVVDVDLYLPGCPPTPELFMAALGGSPDFQPARTVCQECGRKKTRDLRPKHLQGFQRGKVLPDVCLVNQGYLCVGTSTRGGCRALCTRPGHPCVGCRGPSDAFIEKDSSAWFKAIQRVFERMTDIPPVEIAAALRSPQLSLFLFQFADYAAAAGATMGALDRAPGRTLPRRKEQVL